VLSMSWAACSEVMASLRWEESLRFGVL
jgi:hypothetical protein